MIGALARKLFGSSNERRIRSYQPRVDEINALGSAEVCRRQLDAFRDAGVTHLIVAPWTAGSDPVAEVTATVETFAPNL